MTEVECRKKYLLTSEVSEKDCYTGGKHCATCMHKKDHDRNFNYYDYSYCTCAKRA